MNSQRANYPVRYLKIYLSNNIFNLIYRVKKRILKIILPICVFSQNHDSNNVNNIKGKS